MSQMQSDLGPHPGRLTDDRVKRLFFRSLVASLVLFASDFVSAGRNVMSKQQLEDAVRSNFVGHGNAPSPVTIEKKNMVVYLFGDTAVVTYIKEYRQTRDTTKFSDEDITDVFKRGTTGWLLQFSKFSPVASTAVN
jgi:hypothetical protein